MTDNNIILTNRLDELRQKGKLVVKANGKQLLLIMDGEKIHACNNRCPHEGYPLAEGTIADGCVLTCNWHNWKFNLETGDTLVGGDKLRRYQVSIKGNDIHIDITPPADAVRQKQALDNLEDSFRLHEYDRMAREITRLQKANGDPLDALRHTIWKTYDKMEFGATHAFAGAADWLALRDRFKENEALALVSVVEAVGHFAWDTQREINYPFNQNILDYDAKQFIEAIEDEDENKAVALVRGGIKNGLGYDDFEEALTTAALNHYCDFGHALIYVYKCGQLVKFLGVDVTEPIVLALVRSLVYANREDLIPEFKTYAPALEKWDAKGVDKVSMDDFYGLPTSAALDKCNEASADIEGLYLALLGANCRNMLMFDLAVQARTNNQVQHNVGWLDFTHGLTFSNAVRAQCQKFPDLWAKGLLQMACFAGRNASYLDKAQNVDRWQVTNADNFFAEKLTSLFNHGNPEYIVSCHLLKLLTAAKEEADHAPNSKIKPVILACVNRFLNEPLKRKHVMRTALQSMDFVARED